MQNSEELFNKIIQPNIESSISSLEEFVDGSIHTDFKNEILARILQVKSTYTKSDYETFLFNNGAVEMLELVVNIFDDILTNQKQNEGNEEYEKTI